MEYYVLNTILGQREDFSFRTNFSDDLEDKYCSSKLNPDEKQLISIKIKQEIARDFISDAGKIVVSDRFKNVTEAFASGSVQFIACDIECRTNAKLISSPNFLLQIPELHFFDYDRSEYRGDKDKHLLFAIKKMYINEAELHDYPIARMEELFSVIVVNEVFKNAVQATGLLGMEFIPTGQFTYPTFP